MALPVYYARLLPGQIPIKNGNFENTPTLAGGSRATGTWINGSSGGSLIQDEWGWYFTSNGAGGAYFDGSTSQYGGNALFLQIITPPSSPAISNWAGSNIAIYGCPVSPNTPTIGTGITQTAYFSGTLGPTVGACTVFEERDSSGTLLVSNQTALVSGNIKYKPYSVSFTTNPSTAYITVLLQIIGLDGINNDLAMGAWWSQVKLIQSGTPVRRNGTSRTITAHRRLVGA